MCPASTGRFLLIGPPGKPSSSFFFFLTSRHWALWDGHEEREVRMQSDLENFSLGINGWMELWMKTKIGCSSLQKDPRDFFVCLWKNEVKRPAKGSRTPWH